MQLTHCSEFVVSHADALILSFGVIVNSKCKFILSKYMFYFVVFVGRACFAMG